MNLLPPGARSMLLKEYWLRVTSVWAILAALAFIAVGALLVPSYFLVQSEEAALMTERQALAEKTDGVSSVERDVKAANALATALRNAEVPQRMSPIIAAVQEAAPTGIALRSYQMERSDRAVEALTIVGVALTRDALISFQRALEATEMFASAEVPIADLVKERDLPFRITVRIADSKTRP